MARKRERDTIRALCGTWNANKADVLFTRRSSVWTWNSFCGTRPVNGNWGGNRGRLFLEDEERKGYWKQVLKDVFSAIFSQFSTHLSPERERHGTKTILNGGWLLVNSEIHTPKYSNDDNYNDEKKNNSAPQWRWWWWSSPFTMRDSSLSLLQYMANMKYANECLNLLPKISITFKNNLYLWQFEDFWNESLRPLPLILCRSFPVTDHSICVFYYVF